MIHLRCILGLHRPEWVMPGGRGPVQDTWSPRVRRCRDCKRPLGRQHRDD